jgi:GIY-YIG catalytic domain-containing protein
MAQPNSDNTNIPPFETADLRRNLVEFLDSEFFVQNINRMTKIGGFKWGVYAFFDYDGEPIYVGQTNEQIRTRIRRHLTNQRTDAVAMSVLDPFEVYEIQVWPLPEFQSVSGSDPHARAHLDALEFLVYEDAIRKSKFGAVLNEKNPPRPTLNVEIPLSLRKRIVSDAVYKIRSHPDFRIARRALIISRLAQVISERKVQDGLRRVLLTQAKRLQWLAQRRYDALGGDALVRSENESDQSADLD